MAEETRDFTELEGFMLVCIGGYRAEGFSRWMGFVAGIAIRTLGRMGVCPLDGTVEPVAALLLHVR
jgi:hypothetical protein